MHFIPSRKCHKHCNIMCKGIFKYMTTCIDITCDCIVYCMVTLEQCNLVCGDIYYLASRYIILPLFLQLTYTCTK